MSRLPKHVQVYIDFFGYDEGEFIPSEISGDPAVDIHHLYAKQMGGKKTFMHDGEEIDIDDIRNLMALTREQHDDAHNEIYPRDMLWDLHQKVIRNHLMNNPK